MTETMPPGLAEFVARFQSSWQQRDLEGLLSLWDDDHAQATYVAEEVPGAMVGLEAIRRYWRSVFDRFDDIRITLRPLAHEIWNGQAWLIGHGGFSGLRVSDGTRVATSGVRVAVLLRQRPGGWKVVHYVEAPVRDG